MVMVGRGHMDDWHVLDTYCCGGRGGGRGIGWPLCERKRREGEIKSTLLKLFENYSPAVKPTYSSNLHQFNVHKLIHITNVSQLHL